MAVPKILPIFATVKTSMRIDASTKGEKRFKPRLYWNDGLIFMPILHDGGFCCNLSLMRIRYWRMPSNDFLPFGCSIGVLTNRKSIRFFCIRTRRIRATSKHCMQYATDNQFRVLCPSAATTRRPRHDTAHHSSTPVNYHPAFQSMDRHQERILQPYLRVSRHPSFGPPRQSRIFVSDRRSGCY